jgi:glycosyltransferase involved in cell wall biosynthesis
MRLAVIVSHPIQYFAPWHREVAKLDGMDLRVYFCCDWGSAEYTDPQFQVPVKWDIPLLDGYAHEFLPIHRRPERLGFWEVDNPEVGRVLDRFKPDVVQLFGYAHRTNWRVAAWARRRGTPLLLFSDSNASARRAWWKQVAKQVVVRRFYDSVDGALFVSEQNLAYHLQYGVPRDRLFRCAFPIDRGRLLAAVPDRDEARRAVRQRHGIPTEAFVVMLCAKYVEHKRPLELVAACWALHRKGLPVWAVLVGEGPERQAIEAFCQRQGVSNAVLTGFVNQSSIPQYYAASDLVALTSSREPYGLAVSEGASFGLPAVVSDRVGCVGDSDDARPGVNALVYPSGDREQLQSSIERLYRDRALYERMAAASAEISKDHDVPMAARAMAAAAAKLQRLGPRH